MWINKQGECYFGDCVVGDRAATEIEISDWKSSKNPDISLLRGAAYREESDPLFFKEQAGEVPLGTWAEKRTEIRKRYPK